MALLNPAHINDLLQSILDVACSCLEDTPSGVPSDCFISHGQPPDDCCNFLAIWIDKIHPRIGPENSDFFIGEKVWTRCGDFGMIADFSLRLMRPCFPTLVDNPMNPFPPAADVQAAAENLLIDIQVLRCCISSAICEGILLPSTSDADCLEIAVGDIYPVGPRGGCAGWTLQFSVELDACWFGELSLSS
jgi:hypothetical protein